MVAYLSAGETTVRIFRRSIVVTGRQYRRRGGAYYGYELNTRMFDGPSGHLAQEIMKLGCFPNPRQLPKLPKEQYKALIGQWDE
jgi:hypothetical protein